MLEQVNKFMALMDQEMPDKPTIPSQAIQQLRYGLIDEENKELADAAAAGDLVEVADALCDCLYVVLGAFTAYGFKPELVESLFAEVQRSNMSKVCKTRLEAKSTQEYYTERGISTFIKETEQTDDNLYVVVRSNDEKVLKSINYSAPKLSDVLKARDQETTARS